MSAETSIYFLAVLLIGMPSALLVQVVPRVRIRIRNATALAMVATWLFGQLVWALTNEWLPVRAMILSDMIVIAAVFAKHDWQDCSPYRNMGQQFAALWCERSPWDRAIIGLFVPAWLLYAPILPPTPQFWALWGIGLAQLALAGHEALYLWQRAAGQMSRADAPGKPPGSFFAPAREWGYG